MKRIISLLILSAGIIIILLSIGDIGEIIDETQKQQNTVDFGRIGNCNPSRAICSIRSQFDNQSVKLSIQMDERIVVLTPFEIKLQIEGISNHKIKEASIDFSMIDMDMGVNNQFFKLLKTEGSQNSHWSAIGNLAVCVSGRSDWLATINIQVDDKNIMLSLPFTARRH